MTCEQRHSSPGARLTRHALLLVAASTLQVLVWLMVAWCCTTLASPGAGRWRGFVAHDPSRPSELVLASESRTWYARTVRTTRVAAPPNADHRPFALGTIVPLAQLEALGGPMPVPLRQQIIIVEVGFPLACLRGRLTVDSRTEQVVASDHWWWVAGSPSTSNDWGVPVGIVLSGWAGNTLTYACLVWAGWCLTSECRTRLQRRTNTRAHSCPRCGYSTVGLPCTAACPECGATWQARQTGQPHTSHGQP